MVKTILLKIDDSLFFRMKADKLRREKVEGSMTWERYIARLFGLANARIKVERGDNNGKEN